MPCVTKLPKNEITRGYFTGRPIVSLTATWQVLCAPLIIPHKISVTRKEKIEINPSENEWRWGHHASTRGHVSLFGSLPHQEKSTGLARQAAARRCRSRGEGEPHIGLVHIPVVLRHHLHHASREPRSARRGSRRQESVRQGQRAGQIRGSRGGRWAPHRGGGLLIAVGVHDADAGVHGGRLILPRLRDVCTPATGGRESD